MTAALTEEMAETRLISGHDRITESNSAESWITRISPPTQHLEVLDKIYNATSTRPLCWSPSVSCEADTFYGWNTDNGIDGVNADVGENGDDTSNSKQKY